MPERKRFFQLMSSLNAHNCWSEWGGYCEIWKCVGRLCEKVAMGWLQELLRSPQTNKLPTKVARPRGTKYNVKVFSWIWLAAWGKKTSSAVLQTKSKVSISNQIRLSNRNWNFETFFKIQILEYALLKSCWPASKGFGLVLITMMFNICVKEIFFTILCESKI